MENVKILRVSELLHSSRAITGSSCHHLRAFSPNRHPHCPHKSNPKTLIPLEHPAILIGTLNLPSQTLKCPHKNCLQFADDGGGSSSSVSICCDILDFSVRLIGKKIHVISWNFIPLNIGGGFLEIIRWKFPDCIGTLLNQCSRVDSITLISPVNNAHYSSKFSYRVYGALESISPLTIVPCSTKSRNDNLIGFLVQIMACECEFCRSGTDLSSTTQGVDNFHCHSFIKPVFVYFCGPAWSWHPLITKLVANVVALSGLKKKMVFMGKEDSQLMFVTTEGTVLHVPRLSRKWLPPPTTNVKGNGECASYAGVVKGVYMQGMVVELEEDVWLLLTDQLLKVPHSLRVGAVISVRNVHFVNPKYSWTKILILGACFKTSVTVKSFSPLETGSNVAFRSQGLLGKFIESLAFSARMWALLVVSSFRRKFAGILSEKEILGSKHKEGLAQLYASSRLPSSVFRARHGVFRELCEHDSCGCGSDPSYAGLKLVLPISSFLCHCETVLIRTLLQLENDCAALKGSNEFNSLSCQGRRIFSSEDIGVVLLGSVKICSSSGRLQLVDATGSIDVIVPSLPSTWNPNSIYEVFDYSLIMESTPALEGHLVLDNEMLSCRSILHCVPLARKTYFKVWISFQLGNKTSKNSFFYPMDLKDNLKEIERGKFHLIRVIHKFPAVPKFQGQPVISKRTSKFVEAVILPWDLLLVGKDGITHPTEVSIDQLHKHMECHIDESSQGHVSSKRRKTNHTSPRALSSDLLNNIGDAGSGQNACHGSYVECSEEQTSSSHGIQCLATIRSANNHSLVSAGIFYCTGANVKTDVDCRVTAAKVLLEFESESFSKYEFLQIGAYYITKHHRENSFCNRKDSAYASSFKVLISSNTHFQSLSLSANDVGPTDNSSKNVPPEIVSFGNNGFLYGKLVKLLRTRSSSYSPEACSDICVNIPSNILDLLAANSGKLAERQFKPPYPSEETSSVPQCIWPTMPASVVSSYSNCLFPEGKLVSLQGHVVAVHGFGHCDSFGEFQPKFFPEVTSRLCMHVLVDDQMVKIFGSISKLAYPIGFGPGVYATFHRILELRGAKGLMLTPVSFIVINFISVVDESAVRKCSNLCSASLMPNVASPEPVSSGLISELIQCLDSKPMRFRCRVCHTESISFHASQVVAVHVLVLEKNKKYNDLLSGSHYQPHLVDIRLAGFVLDDGSSSCCCWADAERAATLLRFHEELPERALESSGQIKWVGIDNIAWNTSIYHVERILKKHERITVKNYGSMADSSCQDLIVSTSSDSTLSSSDHNLLKFLIFNACFSKLWTVVASAMDSNAVRWLEKEHLMETEMTLHSMQNIWVTEVCHTDPLTEAKDLIKEMLTT